MIPPNNKTLSEFGCTAEVPCGWDKEAYRLYALHQLEIIGAMPSRENKIGEDVLLQLLLEEEGAKIYYMHNFQSKNRAWGSTDFALGYPTIYLDSIFENPTNPIVKILKRTTFAHELGHVLIHKPILSNCNQFRHAAQSSYSCMLDIEFDGRNASMKERLTKNLLDYMTPLSERPGHNWTLEEKMEFQANQIMVGLMLPCINLRICIANYMRLSFEHLRAIYGWSPMQALSYRKQSIMEDCIKNIAEAFKVSKQMAAIEIGRLMHSEHDASLFMGRMVYPKAFCITRQ